MRYNGVYIIEDFTTYVIHMKTYKMKATADIRIRLADGIKTDVTK